MGRSMGVALLPPAEMENQFLGLFALFRFPSIQKSDNLKLSKSVFCPQNPERQTMPENEEVAPIPPAEAQQEAAQTSDAKAEATGTASDELAEGDLEAVAGGIGLKTPGKWFVGKIT